MGQKITFRVFETTTNKDVTDEFNWFIDSYGDLCFEVEDIDSPVMMAGDNYYYQITIHNVQP